MKFYEASFFAIEEKDEEIQTHLVRQSDDCVVFHINTSNNHYDTPRVTIFMSNRSARDFIRDIMIECESFLDTDKEMKRYV